MVNFQILVPVSRQAGQEWNVVGPKTLNVRNSLAFLVINLLRLSLGPGTKYVSIHDLLSFQPLDGLDCGSRRHLFSLKCECLHKASKEIAF